MTNNNMKIGHGHYRVALNRYVNRYLYGAIAAIVYEYLSLLRPNSYITQQQPSMGSSKYGNGDNTSNNDKKDAMDDPNHNDNVYDFPSLPAGGMCGGGNHRHGCGCEFCEDLWWDGIGGLFD
jgi:hypothetical protein